MSPGAAAAAPPVQSAEDPSPLATCWEKGIKVTLTAGAARCLVRHSVPRAKCLSVLGLELSACRHAMVAGDERDQVPAPSLTEPIPQISTHPIRSAPKSTPPNTGLDSVTCQPHLPA